MESRRFHIRRLHRAGNCAQITIPKVLCQAVGLEVGTQVYVYEVNRIICIKRFDEGGFRPDVIPVRALLSPEKLPGAPEGG